MDTKLCQSSEAWNEAQTAQKLRKIRSCSSSMVVDFSCRGAQADSHGSAVQQTMVFPQLQFLCEVIDVPGMQLVQVRRCVQRQVPSTAAVHQQGPFLPCRGAEADSHGLTVEADHRDSPFAVYGGRCPCCVGRAGSLVSGSHLYVIRCSPVEYRFMDFLGDPRNVPYSALLGSTVDTCSRGFLGEIHTCST